MLPDDGQIAARLTEVSKAVDGVHRRLDRHAETTERRLEEINETLHHHNGRLRLVEAWRERVVGALAVAGGSKPVVVGVLVVLAGLAAERLLT